MLTITWLGMSRLHQGRRFEQIMSLYPSQLLALDLCLVWLEIVEEMSRDQG